MIKWENIVLKFPEHHKNNKEILNYSFNNIQQLNITEHDIEKIISYAFETAQENVPMVNMTSLLKDRIFIHYLN